jgi:dipeptidyl-peptidase-4
MKSSYYLSLVLVFSCIFSYAQPPQGINWAKDGKSYYKLDGDKILQTVFPEQTDVVVAGNTELTPKGSKKALKVRNFFFTDDGSKILIYTNTVKVWRYDTRGDYWVLDLKSKQLTQLGKSLPVSSLMFAKFNKDGSKVAYVSEYNLYVEDVRSFKIQALTKDGNRKNINGTFDWAYEEEFACRDGFRWSPDGKQIAYWQIDARTTKDYLMIDNISDVYSKVIPVEYPSAGEPPSPYKIGIVNISNAKTKWMDIPTDKVLQTYVTRLEWTPKADEVIIQHLNRKQNVSNIMLCNVKTGKSSSIYEEKDNAWIDIQSSWDYDYEYGGWDWFNGGKEFLWSSEKDGWRHLYRMGIDGSEEILITVGDYDVMDICAIDEPTGYVYFMASPDNATQKYLYRTTLDGKGKAERLSPSNQVGTHGYEVSPTGAFAFHTFNNHYTPPAREVVSLPMHKAIKGDNVEKTIAKADKSKAKAEFLTITTEEGITMDAWMVKPKNFDSSKKYPIVFYVYTEPAGQNVKDVYGTGSNGNYRGDMAADGYIYMSIDNRGTPVPKGREWRKSIYRKIGIVNIRDQAMAAKKILELPFVDTSRVAVWGWSGGGSATLNLMFQYPEIYKTGISIAAVANQLTYDNIYQERFMGIPQENMEDFVNGSPMTYAKNLRGNLLYIHGTGDDNVHYNNADMLINELVKYNKQFQFMSYPNRSHGISEGEGTRLHLSTLFTAYLKEHCPPGGR